MTDTPQKGGFLGAITWLVTTANRGGERKNGMEYLIGDHQNRGRKKKKKGKDDTEN